MVVILGLISIFAIVIGCILLFGGNDNSESKKPSYKFYGFLILLILFVLLVLRVPSLMPIIAAILMIVALIAIPFALNKKDEAKETNQKKQDSTK